MGEPEGVGGSKFCDICQYLVIDFTKLTQKEFDNAVRNSPGRLCGRFKQSQMSPRFLRYAAVTVMTASVLAPTSCMQEDALPTEDQTPSLQESVDERVFYTTGIIAIPDTAINASDTTLSDEPFDEEIEFDDKKE
jgi:hypothetical protein